MVLLARGTAHFDLPAQRRLARLVGVAALSMLGCASEHGSVSEGARSVTAADDASSDSENIAAEQRSPSTAGQEAASHPSANSASSPPRTQPVDASVFDSGTSNSDLDAGVADDAGGPADARVAPDALIYDGSLAQDGATRSGDADVQLADATAQLDASDACPTGDCPYSIGNFRVDEAWGELLTQPDQLYLVPIVAPHGAALQTFGFVSREALVPARGACRFAIYDDAADHPKTLLTWSFVNATAVDGESSVPAGSTGVRLVAGATYWVGIECFHPSGSVRLRSKAVAAANIVRLAHPVGSEFPAQLTGSGQVESGTALAVFIQVKDLPR